MTKYIFLHGAVHNRTIDQLNEFALAASEINALGFNVVTAMEGFPNPDEASDEQKRLKYLSDRLDKVLKAQHVVLLDQYEYDHSCIKDARHARAEGIPVSNIMNFLVNFKEAVPNNIIPKS